MISDSGLNSGAKNIRPWMWSRCRCVRRMWIGRSTRGSANPRLRIPVPASRIRVLPSDSVTSTHEVLPP